MSSSEACRCVYCKNDRPFDIPQHLVEELLQGNVVLFAGAGISTENRDHAQHTLYDAISKELKAGESLSFPALMSAYCEQPDGRIKLAKHIKSRFDYFTSFSDFYCDMTRFHKAISPLYMIKNIVTTNWDDFFERECDLDAFVNDSDMSLWEASERRVMKIHGSIRNFGSIIATEEDYRRSFRRLNDGPMGARLKSLLTTKTFIYTGYSLSDENYRALAKRIASMTRPHTRHSYIIAPKIDYSKIEKFPIPLIPIETDGAYFFEQLRLHIENKCGLVREEAFDACEGLLSKVMLEHDRTGDAFARTQHPLLIFALSYQDGLIHGLNRIQKRRASGEYHCLHRVVSRVRGYENRSREFRKKRDFWNSYYSDGYGDAMLSLLLAIDHPELMRPAIFGKFGDIEFNSLSSILRFPKKRIKGTYRAQANKIIAELSSVTDSYIPQHTPYL
jgi:hypothetical protein